MLELSLEIPTVMLKRWSPLIDLDFVLAHKALVDEDYANHFLFRPDGRKVILDNSTHEFGKPIPIMALSCACNLVNADYVIAPDIVKPLAEMSDEMVSRNRRWLEHAAASLPPQYELGSVLCGMTKQDRLDYTTNAIQEGAQLLCFTFHEPERLKWWEELETLIANSAIHRVHLLGMASFEELRRWVEISEEHPEIAWSFDTSKPLKWGAQLISLRDFDGSRSVRGGAIKSLQVLEMTEFSPEQIVTIEDNIKYLRAVCRGEE